MTVYDANNVPVLYLGEGRKVGMSQAAHNALQKTHASALKAIESDGPESYSKHLLLGEVVLIHNKAPVSQIVKGADGKPVTGPDGGFVYHEGGPDFTTAKIGASNLDEAVKDAIGGFDAHVGDPDQSSDHIHPPDWVASTHKELAKALADYYSCDVRDIAEVLS